MEKTYTVRDLQEDYQTGRIRDFSDLERAIERLLRGQKPGQLNRLAAEFELRGGKVQESFQGAED